MSRLTAGVFACLFTALGGLYAWTRLRYEMGGAEAAGLVIVEGPAKHLVTEQMAAESRLMVGRAAPPFEASASDGRRYMLGELCRRGPVVLTFIKDGCPCSEAAQPFFDRLRVAYPGAGFFGVIDRDLEKAKRWAGRFRVAYPLLLDPAYRIVQDYHAENSAYVVLINREGRIRQHWPGYSAGMLRELAASLGELTGTAAQAIDVADAPDELYSGCPYDL